MPHCSIPGSEQTLQTLCGMGCLSSLLDYGQVWRAGAGLASVLPQVRQRPFAAPFPLPGRCMQTWFGSCDLELQKLAARVTMLYLVCRLMNDTYNQLSTILSFFGLRASEEALRQVESGSVHTAVSLFDWSMTCTCAVLSHPVALPLGPMCAQAIAESDLDAMAKLEEQGALPGRNVQDHGQGAKVREVRG